MANTVLVTVDWGTSSCRAYAMDGNGAVLRSDSRAGGIRQPGLSDAGAYEAALSTILQRLDVDDPAVPVVLAGMIGSAQGWVDVACRDLPCDLFSPDALRQHTTSCGRTVHFVRGLREPAGTFGVLRGEEAQLAGLSGDAARLVVLPGTHSKWAVLEGSRALRFSTFMTGEMLRALSRHTILDAFIDDHSTVEATGFLQGLGIAAGSTAGVLSDVFAARTLPLAGAVPARDTLGLLCGILIGHEVGAGIRHYRDDLDNGVVICARADIASEYRTAFECAGVTATTADPDAAATGMWRLAVSHGLIGARP